MGLLLADLVATHEAVAATRSRLAKTASLAELLARCAPDEVGIVVDYLSGVVPQRRLGVGWRSLSDLPPPSTQASLTIADVNAAFEVLARASGTGSAAVRRTTLHELLGRATRAEQDFLRALITGNLRQGALDGVVVQAIAGAYAVPEPVVRRAVMLAGSAAVVAQTAAASGEEGCASIGLVVGRPIRPMLAASAKTIAEGIDAVGGGAVVVDCKLDGIRLQIHRRDGEVSLFTRSLDEITDRLPEVVEEITALPGGDLVLDGEAIALAPDGRPLAFQETGARTASSADPAALRERTPVSTFLFDIVHRDGADLLDEDARTRDQHLREIAAHLMVERIITESATDAVDFSERVLQHGHEGVVIKAATSTYAAGRRGSGWVKVKPVHTVDLVVLAVEWGSGRRQGWLSNIHLGARDSRTGELVMVGKTFKGMTDEMLRWQTERFRELAVGPTDGWVVQVRPEQVVEIAFDGVQRSTRYPGGIALRFARVQRYRDDKTIDAIDTLDTLRGR